MKSNIRILPLECRFFYDFFRFQRILKNVLGLSGPRLQSSPAQLSQSGTATLPNPCLDRMATCLAEMYIWSLKGHVIIPDYVVGCHTYHDKNELVSLSEHPYGEEKQQYIEGRDGTWTPKNKRPDRLRDTLKEAEELLAQYRVVQCRWKSRRMLQLVLSNLCIITFVISCHSGDVEKMFVDKSMVGRLNSDQVSDAYLTDQFLLVTYYDKIKMDFVYFVRRPPIGETNKRLEKLTSWEPKIMQLDLPGPVGRRLERHVSVNIHGNMVLLWWPVSSEEALPWSPMATEKDRANLVILSLRGPNIDILTYTTTEFNPLSGVFSGIQPHKIYTVEHARGGGPEGSLHRCIYEVVQGRIQRTSLVSIPLKSGLLCHAHNPREDKLVIGLADGCLLMYDAHKKTTFITKSALIPAAVGWHPSGSLFIVGSSGGDIQVFDMALCLLRIQMVAEEPSPKRVLQLGRYFRPTTSLQDIRWCVLDPHLSEWSGDYIDALYMQFDRGPPVLIQFYLGVVSQDRFSLVELGREYIKHRQIDEALGLLNNMNWDVEGPSCYSCLSSIVNHLLKMPLNMDREGKTLSALGMFYAPKQPLSEVTILDYRDPISRLARRFFHHLLRYARFDKAFLLAVDIGARDLFMDIHYVALDKGEMALAEVAKRKAEQIESESLDSLVELDDVGGDYVHLQNGHNGHSQTEKSYVAEEVPASRQHPWQQEYHRVPTTQASSSHQFLDGEARRHRPVPDWSRQDAVQDDDLDLDFDPDMLRNYTAAFINETSNRERRHEDKDKTEETNGESDVIHLGVI
ncbi:hypothetical protein ScPMuIL_013547 [Solemya velum]